MKTNGVKIPKIKDPKDSEKYLESSLVRRVKSLGGKALKWQSVNTRGVPDRIVLMPGGKTYLVETKSKGCKLSPLQQLFKIEAESIGHTVYVVDRVELLDQFITLIKNEQL